MTYQHKNLASGHWHELSLIEQMANIGSEVERAIKWRNKGKEEIAYKGVSVVIPRRPCIHVYKTKKTRSTK